MSQPPTEPPRSTGDQPTGDQPTGDQPTYGQPTYGQPDYGSSYGGQPSGQPANPQHSDPQQPYVQPQYGQQPQQSGWSQPSPAQYGADVRSTEAGYAQMYGQKRSTGMSVAALVLGIVGLIFCWIPIVGTVLAVLALIFGIVGVRRQAGKGMAVTGIVLGGLALVGSILVLLFVVQVGTDLVQITNDCIDETGQSSGPAFERCINDKSRNYNPFD